VTLYTTAHTELQILNITVFKRPQISYPQTTNTNDLTRLLCFLLIAFDYSFGNYIPS